MGRKQGNLTNTAKHVQTEGGESKHDTITQAELERVLEMNDQLNAVAWRLERRIADGAQIEPGQYDAYTTGAEDAPPDPVDGLGFENLNIGKSEHIAAVKEAYAAAGLVVD